MRVLVTWGSKLGGTAGIGEMIAHTLEEAGHDVVAVPASHAPSPKDFDAAVVGGALYANRWRASARHWVERHVRELSDIPTWMFSSGPLDTSADDGDIPPPREIRSLMRRIGAVDHHTFGGRLEKDVQGFPQRAMAAEHAGDWRNPERIRAWATEISRELPTIRPRPAEVLHGHALSRLVEYGAYGWAVSALTLGILLPLTRPSFAIAVHLIVAPVVFAVLARRYQSADGARSPLVTAVTWTAMVGVLDASLVAAVVRPNIVLLGSAAAYWVPLALVFVASWAIGAVAAMLPVPVTRSGATPAIRA